MTSGARDSEELRRILSAAQENEFAAVAAPLSSPDQHRHHRQRHCVSALAESIRRLVLLSGLRADEARRMHEVARTRTAADTTNDEEVDRAGGDLRMRRDCASPPEDESASVESHVPGTSQEAETKSDHLAIHAIIQEKAVIDRGSSTEELFRSPPRGRIVSSSGGGVVVMAASTGNASAASVGDIMSSSSTTTSDRMQKQQQQQSKKPVRRARCA